MSYSQPSDFVRKAVWDQRTSLTSTFDACNLRP